MTFKRKKGDAQAKNKYNNQKVEYNGMKFDSKRELERYLVLLDRSNRGEITDLTRQEKFVIIPSMYKTEAVQLKTKTKEVQRLVQHGITYTADFSYYIDGEKVVEDVKISKFLLPKEYELKKKLMRYIHGITIKEVYKTSEL